MKKLYSILASFAFLTCLMLLASCSGSSDSDDPGPGTGPDDGKLHIKVDKTTLVADGADKVTFTVTLGNKDVSDESTMNLILVKVTGDEKLGYGVHSFSTLVAGTYVFKARYYDGGEILSEEKVTVVATASTGGKNYYHKLLGMQFTSIGCQNCPALSASLKSIREDQPGRLAVASFHMDFEITDPMGIPETDNYRTKILGNFGGLPRFFFNLRKGTKEMISIKSQIEGELQSELANFPTTCGVAITSNYDPFTKKVEITGKLTSNVKNSYRCLIYLVEDGIPYFQTNGGNGYIHNNVVRSVVSSSLNGDKFSEEAQPDKEMTMSRSVTLNSAWNVDNMRIIVSMLTSLDGGKTYTCNNVNECKVGESVGYLFNE